MSRIRLVSIFGTFFLICILFACSQGGDEPPARPGERPPVEEDEEVSDTHETMEQIQLLYDEICNNVSAFTKSRRDVDAGAENTRLLIRLFERDEVKGYSSEQKFQDHLAIILERAREVLEHMEAGDAKQARSSALRLGATCGGCHRDYRDEQPGHHTEKPR